MERFTRFGSVSEHTLRSEDLLPAFLEEARDRYKNDPEVLNHEILDIDRIVGAIDEIGDDKVSEAFWDSEWVSITINETLFDLLNNDLPPYVHFGAHEGNGSDFGYWISWSAFEDDAMMIGGRFGEIAKLEDLPEDLEAFAEENPDVQYIATVTDHGNVTLWTMTGEEIWSVV